MKNPFKVSNKNLDNFLLANNVILDYPEIYFLLKSKVEVQLSTRRINYLSSPFDLLFDNITTTFYNSYLILLSSLISAEYGYSFALIFVRYTAHTYHGNHFERAIVHGY